MGRIAGSLATTCAAAALALAGCAGDDVAADTGGDDRPPPPMLSPLDLRADGWLRGDLHAHSNYSHDGDDAVDTLLRLAEFTADPRFLAFHPELVDDALDFLGLADHRTVAGVRDPGWTSSRIIAIGGEEFGGAEGLGHAVISGIDEYVDHDPGADGTIRADIEAAIDATHAQGGVFIAAHPTLSYMPWGWDVDALDGLEVWNSGWALGNPEIGAAELSALVARGGEVSDYLARAVELQGRGGGMQALAMYEAYLARGVHLALVGGSDHHAALPLGAPVTYVRADTADAAGVIEGIRARRTFVARHAGAAQLEFDVHVGDAVYSFGDAIPIPRDGASVVLSLRVARAVGGRAFLIGGVAREALAGAPLGGPLVDAWVDDYDTLIARSFWAEPGDWVYPMVWESLYAPGLDDAGRGAVDGLALLARDSGIATYQIVNALETRGVLNAPQLCDVDAWRADELQCMPVDASGLATFYVPDHLDRALNVIVEDGAPSPWVMGALGSAVRFVADPNEAPAE